MIKKTIFFCFIFFIGGLKYGKAQNSLKTLIDVVQINDIKSIEEKTIDKYKYSYIILDNNMNITVKTEFYEINPNNYYGLASLYKLINK